MTRRRVSERLDEWACRRFENLLRRSIRGDGIPPALDIPVSRALTQAVSTGVGSRPPRSIEQSVIDNFHKLYYNHLESTWLQTRYRGVQVLKCPLDLWIYQELLTDVRPDLIVETGTWSGGSAYYLADLCDVLDIGRVISIDIEPQPQRPAHPRLTYLEGSSVDQRIIDTVRAAAGEGSVMVILDSDHSAAHVFRELAVYADLVTDGSYAIVEDGNVNGHPVLPEFGPGPTEAVAQFLAERDDFTADRTRELFLLTFNPGGYLRRTVAP